MTDVRLLASRVCAELGRYAYRLSSEEAIQDGIEAVLTEAGYHAGYHFLREHVIGADRFDFFLDGGVVIEVKSAGSYAQALGQAERYTRQELVGAVIIASTRRWRRLPADPVTLNGKPVYTLLLRGRGL